MVIRIQFFDPKSSDMKVLLLEFQSTKELKEKIIKAGIKAIALCRTSNSYPQDNEYLDSLNLSVETMEDGGIYLCKVEESEHLIKIASTWSENEEV